jgi:hypothetical protein
MRKLARLIPLALVLLPGCVFHIRDEGDWDDDRPSLQKRLDQLDHRVRDLEQAMAQDSGMHGKSMGTPGVSVQELHAPAAPAAPAAPSAPKQP